LVKHLISKSDVGDILDSALNSRRLGLDECTRLIKSEDAYSIGLVGNILRQRLYGNTATFVNNIILNYTNVCITYCKFCAFYRPPGHKESYTLPLKEIVRRILVSRELFGITQALIQGGHNPNLRSNIMKKLLRR
jgi:cyclic dehypoxanthinyl futalosine synthase